jgi:photosystem II stability/assembly factor-like uncharacterized protein
MNFTWHATGATPTGVHRRYDDIWFINPQVGWAVNATGQIVHTEDAGATWTPQHQANVKTWLRCMGFTSPTDGWVGTIKTEQRLFKTQDGRNWTDITSTIPPLPSAICGMSSPSKGVVWASGTQFPLVEAGIMHTADGGQNWKSISMAAHANLLIDNYFVDDLTGWVVGGVGGTSYEELKPVIMFTSDGGKTWVNRLQNSGIDFPTGEWGWKIQFLTPQLGFVSLENMNAGAILKTTDGGQTWKRIVINDPQRNIDLEGVGFINEQVGWAGGWGHGFEEGVEDGTTSGTTDGGATWFDANDVLRFVNRFRFFKEPGPIVGYASGRTVYQCRAEQVGVTASVAPAVRVSEAPIPQVYEAMEIKAQVPDNASQVEIAIFNPRQKLVKVLEEKAPRAGTRTFSWDFKTDDGADAGTGYFIYRVAIDGEVTSDMVARAARAAPDVLGAQVVQLIQRLAVRAERAHDELALPDANGHPVALVDLFDTPTELMAALIRGGWVIPGKASRSMFLEAIIKTGPMRSVLAQADIDLLTDWVNTGAVVPAATG